MEWCTAALQKPVRREVQSEDGRIRHWLYVPEFGRYLRTKTGDRPRFSEK
jgi:hypothetical protein